MSAHLRAIQSVLTKGAANHERRHGERPRGACLHEKVDHRTPFDELAEKDDRTPFDELGEMERELAREGEERMKMMLESLFWLFDFIFAAGPHPGHVMRRLYALVKKFAPHLIWDMGYREIGKLFGESGAAVEWRVSVLIDDYLQARGHVAVKMPWQRDREACGNYADSQKGNQNRSGGNRSGKTKAKQHASI